MDRSRGDDAGVNLFLTQQNGAWRLFRRAERVFGNHGEAINVRAIEGWDVDGRYNVRCEHAAERRVERNYFSAAGRAVDRVTETPLGFVAVEDLEELFLLTHA
jgi:hypothetical protein